MMYWKKVTFLLAMTLLFGCQHSEKNNTLYSELGGKAGIEKIVNQFIYEIGYHKSLSQHFEKTNLNHFRSKLTEQLCQLSDGPCHYSGDSMSEVHQHMDITEATFNQTVELFIQAMTESQIPISIQNRLLARLALLRKDILSNQYQE